jgi:hypothetical protein
VGLVDRSHACRIEVDIMSGRQRCWIVTDGSSCDMLSDSTTQFLMSCTFEIRSNSIILRYLGLREFVQLSQVGLGKPRGDTRPGRAPEACNNSQLLEGGKDGKKTIFCHKSSDLDTISSDGLPVDSVISSWVCTEFDAFRSSLQR